MAISEKTALRHDQWRRQILKIIREEPKASRITVKKQSGLSMESTLAMIDELLNDRLIESVGKEDAGHAGRKATILKINPDGAYFIGVRFSAGNVAAVCMDFLQRPVFRESLEFSEAPDGEMMLDAIYTVLQKLLARMGDKRNLLHGIGIGAPGIIDLDSGTLLRYVHIPGWQNVPLRSLIEERFSVPTYLEHGVKCTARAVLAQPENIGTRDLLFVQMGRGINMCVVTDGHVVNGSTYLSGEIGHITVAGNDLPCECGKHGCLETLVANGAMASSARKLLAEPPGRAPMLAEKTASGERLSMHLICSCAEAGDEGLRSLLSDAGRALGETLSSSILLMNPGKVMIDGTLTDSRFFRDSLIDALKQHCLPESLKTTDLRFLTADRFLDAAGAAQLPFHKEFGAEDGMVL